MGDKPLHKLLNLNAQGGMHNLLMQYENCFHFIVVYLECPERRVCLKWSCQSIKSQKKLLIQLIKHGF